MIDLTIVTVNYGSSQLLAKCLESLRPALATIPAEILVYDNGSDDPGLPEILRTVPEARPISGKRRVSFGAANNACAAEALGAYFLFLNPDTTAKPGAIETLLAFMKSHARCGSAGPLLVDERGRIEFSFARDPGILSEALMLLRKRLSGTSPPMMQNGGKPGKIDWISGAAMLVRREAFEQVTGFDEEYPLYFEDADLCRRMRRFGWQIAYCPDARIIHKRGGTQTDPIRQDSKYRRSQLRYYRKHRGLIENYLLRLYLRLRGGGNSDSEPR